MIYPHLTNCYVCVKPEWHRQPFTISACILAAIMATSLLFPYFDNAVSQWTTQVTCHSFVALRPVSIPKPQPMNPYFFHTQLWFPVSGRDFRRFEGEFHCFLWNYHKKENIVEEIESIMGARTERSSPSWICIPQKSLVIARDFWNTKSLGWTPFGTGAHKRFYFFHNVFPMMDSLYPVASMYFTYGKW